MLPSRGMLRSSGTQRQFLVKAASHGRGFGTLRPAVHGSKSSPLATLRSKTVAPLALGSAASARHLSLWGYGSKKSEAAPSTNPIESSSAAESGQSLASQANAQSVPIDATPASSTTSPPADLSAISDIVNESTTSSSGYEILSRSQDYIGYLHDLGLNYGWGFTSSMQWVIEHIHVWGGLPWGLSIMSAAVALRVAMFYPMIRSTAFAARTRRMQEDPRHEKIKELMKPGVMADPVKSQQLRAVQGVLRQEYNTPASGILWGFLPIPFSFGLFRAVSGMTTLPVPGWESAGYLWFQDLTATDPYFILPIITAGLMSVTMRVNRRNTAVSQRATMDKISWVLFPVIVFATCWLSAAVNLMGLAFGGSTLAASALLNMNTVRRLLRIPLAYDDTPTKPVATYTAPRDPTAPVAVEKTGTQSIRAGFDNLIKSAKEQGSSIMPTGQKKDQEEKARKQRIQKAEEMAAAQRERDFINKYKK